MLSNRRIVFDRYGGPEVLHMLKEDVPAPKSNEVLVQVLVTGVAHGDIMIRKGVLTPPFQKLPVTPGFEIVGVVKEVGSGVTSVRADQLVAALTVIGGYSEYICIKHDELVPLPEGIKPEEAACIALNYSTAYQMLHRYAKVQKGEKVLVHGAAGGVGTALLQLGKLSDLEMLGTASQSRHPFISSLHATPIDYRNTDFVEEIRSRFPKGIDAVFDPIGGNNYKRSYQVLRKGGRLIGYGFQNAESKPFVLSSFMRLMSYKLVPDGKRSIFYSIAVTRNSKRVWLKEDLNILFQLLAKGAIQPVIQQIFPLSDAKAAHELFELGGGTGKILLSCRSQ
ncbi:medium chain dehydrogenase/reductase family protein [Paenibacillus macquariensis]|uniref:NADPH2:quinone reductase n=1 Tax=Paenibacillus macquariensis TaxID=948756 RepID=A0ABY1JW52_9BACL|nr:medium chain dehydrogenase/reductase family protein [Paenibacillus macquariensis]MEC0090662.1 medium chain dehydrogenase/reductase family protein [Paenibacillus macquariensis]SIQ86828.1 NADPH2:quinone reductase [Paenibacillus macquariensis]